MKNHTVDVDGKNIKKNLTHFAGTISVSLVWRVIATINSKAETISEQPLGSIVLPGLEQTFFFPLEFGTKYEGVRR